MQVAATNLGDRVEINSVEISEQNDIVTKAKMKSAHAALGVCGFHLGISVGGKHDRIDCSGI